MLRSARPILGCLIAAALFGASTPASKSLLSDVGPFTLAGLLYLGAALAMLPFSLKDGLTNVVMDRRNRLRLAGVVLFGGVLAPVLLLTALSASPAASVALWLTFESAATAILAWALFREHMGIQTWIGVACLVIAGALLVPPSDFGTLKSAVLVALACACWGLDNNLTSLIDGATPPRTTLVKGLAAGSVNLAIGLWLEGRVESPRVVAISLLLGALSYGLSLVLYVAGAQQLGAVRSQMVFATAPFWGVLVAWVALSEAMRLSQWIAGGLGAVALWMMHSERHAHEHEHEAVTHTHWHRHDDGHHEHAHSRQQSTLAHSHEHTHGPAAHTHAHAPDLHHRHAHGPHALRGRTSLRPPPSSPSDSRC